MKEQGYAKVMEGEKTRERDRLICLEKESRLTDWLAKYRMSEYIKKKKYVQEDGNTC